MVLPNFVVASAILLVSLRLAIGPPYEANLSVKWGISGLIDLPLPPSPMRAVTS